MIISTSFGTRVTLRNISANKSYNDKYNEDWLKYKLGEIREMARDVLVGDFLDSLPHLTGTDKDDGFEVPSIVSSKGHRWGAAFPILSQEFTDMDCQLIASEQFVACGDYFGKLSGRIEGAHLSGRSAATEILKLNGNGIS